MIAKGPPLTPCSEDLESSSARTHQFEILHRSKGAIANVTDIRYILLGILLYHFPPSSEPTL